MMLVQTTINRQHFQQRKYHLKSNLGTTKSTDACLQTIDNYEFTIKLGMFTFYFTEIGRFPLSLPLPLPFR